MYDETFEIMYKIMQNPIKFLDYLIEEHSVHKKIACPVCGHPIGTVTEEWSARNCPHCGLLVFKE